MVGRYPCFLRHWNVSLLFRKTCCPGSSSFSERWIDTHGADDHADEFYEFHTFRGVKVST